MRRGHDEESFRRLWSSRVAMAIVKTGSQAAARRFGVVIGEVHDGGGAHDSIADCDEGILLHPEAMNCMFDNDRGALAGGLRVGG